MLEPVRAVTAVLRLARHRWKARAASVDHETVLLEVADDARLSFRYAFMVIVAVGIATIGLLLNSPAVIIGAMLISPLMSPIVMLGLATATLDPRRAGRGGLSLLLGVLLALAMAAAIVRLSPIDEATPEILARTRPNLFDLLVAALSGAAGGYAVIRGRGETIVGVAIATALMPPIAVVGYGLAVGHWAIVEGAFLLFLTNLVAISVSVAVVGLWYGFGRHGLRRSLAPQVILTGLVVVPLLIPLYTSLETIATETQATRVARQVLQDLAGSKRQSRIAVHVSAPRGEPISIEASVLTQQARPDLEAEAARRLRDMLRREVTMHVDQVEVADIAARTARVSAVANPVRPSAALSLPLDAAVLRAAFPLPIHVMEVAERGRRVSIVPRPEIRASLGALREMEAELVRKFPGWTISIVPPYHPLPRLTYPLGSAVLSDSERTKLADIVWALRAWQVRRIEVIGYASTPGDGPKALARTRAANVRDVLGAAGLDAVVVGAYPTPGQEELERLAGTAAFQAVEIRVATSS